MKASACETHTLARPLRIEFAGALYHLTTQGDRREHKDAQSPTNAVSASLLKKSVRQNSMVFVKRER
jgi:hypothetical protein